MKWRRIDGAKKLLSRIFKIFKKMKAYDNAFLKKMFLKIFLKMLYLKKKTQKRCPIFFFRRAPVASSACYLRKCLSYPLIHFSVYKLNYTTTIHMHVLACSKRYHRVSKIKLHLIGTFFIDFGHILNLTFFTWPWPDLQFSLLKWLGQSNGYHNRIMWPKWTRKHVSHDLCTSHGEGLRITRPGKGAYTPLISQIPEKLETRNLWGM